MCASDATFWSLCITRMMLVVGKEVDEYAGGSGWMVIIMCAGERRKVDSKNPFTSGTDMKLQSLRGHRDLPSLRQHVSLWMFFDFRKEDDIPYTYGAG